MSVKITQAQRKILAQLALLLIISIQFAITCQATTVQVKNEKLASLNQQAPTAQTTSSYLNNFNLNPANDGDNEDGLYLLGVFDVHAAASGASRRAPFKCGPIDTDAGETSSRRPMQNLWAFLWAIEQVNADESLLPGVKLGSLILDTCSSFLRTNQQLANLLHHDEHDQIIDDKSAKSIKNGLPRARQFLGVVADQYDWRSVEATASMASSLGLTTFVTQSRSTKLSEFARNFNQLSPEDSPGNEAASRPLAQVPSDERLLRELLGIGRMLPANELSLSSDTTSEHKSNRLLMIRMAQNNEIIADALASLCDKMKWDLVSVVYDGAQPDLVDLHDELIRQLLLRNIQLSLDEQMIVNGGTVATTSTNDNQQNSERLLVNLARQAQIGSRVVISLLSIGSARQLQARLHQMRQQNGAGAGSQPLQQQREHLKALNSLLWITTADREPYYTYATDSLGVISASSSSSLLPEFKQFYDQTLELGGGGGSSTVANSTSAPQPSPPQNKWWPEYVRTIMQRHKRELGELLVNECAHWQEPRASPLQARCAHLNLSSLVQTERSQNQKLARRVGSVDQPVSLKLSTTTGNTNRLSLQRYLASGWEHNGMEVINSVLALANGLESVRQSLCPDTKRGLCRRMRDLVHQEQVVVSSPSGSLAHKSDADRAAAASSIKESGNPVEQLVELPTLSELIHSELIRSTFQLADGQMFSLADSPAGDSGGQSTTSATQVSPVAAAATNTQTQLDARLKFYNLRFLRPNSIGFVKFAQFGGGGGSDGASAGLALLNTTMALHYTNIPMDFNELQPIERVQSTCQDERKCLMLSLFSAHNEEEQEQPPVVAGKTDLGARAGDDNKRRQQKLAISEEELAQGVNSLFKLDHPLISSPSSVAQSTSGASEPNHSNGLLAIRTMRLKPLVATTIGLRDPFASDGPDENQAPQPPLAAQRRKPRQFEVIVLLPLSRGGRPREANIAQSGSKSSTGGDGGAAAWRASCPSGPEEEARSFQHLTALAYAQTRAQQLVAALDKQQRVAATRYGNNRSTSGSGGDGQQPFELTISVIDYCDHSAANEIGSDNLIEQQVARLLAGRLSARVRDNSNDNSTGTQLVAIVDFDWRVSQQVAAIVGEFWSSSSSLSEDNNKQAPPVHLTIDHRAHHHHDASGTTAAQASAGRTGTGAGTGTGEVNKALHPSAFRINLLPDKQREIRAMVSLIGADGRHESPFENWRLVHLIYAHDQREFRDEFLRQANEAGICVSKLISIPTITEIADSGIESSIPIETRREYQLERTRALFKRELYDFRTTGSAKSATVSDEANGLNSTRLLVVLASESAATNKLVLEAASESMLQDYVWITTHEWLTSVELPAERAGGVARMPRLFLSTKLESFEGHDFRVFYNHLTPAVHAQLPTDWFDRYWQSHFKCSLPMNYLKSGVGLSDNKPRPPPQCDPRQQLDLDAETQQHALYTIRAIEALQLAIASSLAREPTTTWRQASFARDFRVGFAQGVQVFSMRESKRDSYDRIGMHLIGFHIVHRLVVEQQQTGARRANSRQLDSAGQLVRVGGFSRRGFRNLALFGTKLRTHDKKFSEFHNTIPTDRPAIDSDDQTWGLSPPDKDMRELERIGDSLEYLASIKSHCVSQRTCALCQQQRSSTSELLRQERARMRLESWEPRAMSPLQPVDDQDEDEEDQQSSASKTLTPLDDIQAAASSLFSSRTSQQVAREINYDHHGLWVMAMREQKRRNAAAARSGQQQPLRRLSGVLLSVLSLVGVVFTVASMTYFYPNLLDRQHKYLLGDGRHSQRQLQSSFRSTSSSTCNIITADGGAPSASVLAKSGNSNSLLSSILTNLIDYLMLTGLLMLYSINIAFLQPATLSVCWFRRIGLALSYTLLFSSILAKIHEVHARQPTTTASKRRRRTGSSADSRLVSTGGGLQRAGSHGQQVVNRSHQSLESVDESVEVTFESLPHESGDPSASYQAGEHQMVHQRHLAAAEQSEPDTANSHLQTTPSECAMGEPQEQGAATTSDYFRVPLALIILQIVVGLTWLVKQPPEPTLFHACWHCASLMRSPLMFLYEPLMSLLEPAAILIVSWLWSINLFNRAYSRERQFTLASREFLASQPLSFTLTNSPEYLRHKQLNQELASQLRDSKLLVTTTTLLILIWSLMTLNIVRSSQALLSGLSSGSSNGAISSQQHLDDQSLLYTNLASGALIFALLFVHRLRLFRTGSGSLSTLNSSFSSLNKCDYDQISSASGSGISSPAGKRHRSKSVQSISRRLKSFGRSRRFTTTTTGGHEFDDSLGADPNHLRGGQIHKTLNRPAQQQAERLKLQQFSMTYGTYSPAAFGASTSCELHDQQVVVGAPAELAAPQSQQTGTGQKKKRAGDNNQASDSRSSSTRSLFKLTAGGKRAPGDKNNNKSETGVGTIHQQVNTKKNKKLQQQVGGAFSSSRHSLNGSLSLADDGDSDLDLELPDSDHLMINRGRRGPAGDQDNLSCASNATSQLQGNELYPIDCSIQLVDNIGPPPSQPPPRPQDKQLAGSDVHAEHF